MKKLRGSILVHVMVTGLVIAVIAAGVLRMTLGNYAMASRAKAAEKAQADANANLARLTGYWARTAPYGPLSSGDGYTCVGGSAGNNCWGCAGLCTCTGVGLPTVNVTDMTGGTGYRCRLDVSVNYTPD